MQLSHLSSSRGFRGRPTMRRLLLCAVALMIWPAAVPGPVAATAPEAGSAVVVSTSALDIRSCPQPDCAISATAPLGAEVAITGEAIDGFVPVRYQDKVGFVPPLFLASDPGHPPYLVEGAPGCQRVAFLFNIGVGFEPDLGIIETLETEQVPAAMFLMGWWVEQDATLAQRLADDGYLIGSHGYGSTELTTLPDDEVLEDVRHATEAIESAIGRPMDPYFTPYAAAIDDRVRSIVAAQGMLPVAWNVAAADYGPDVTEEAVYSRVMNNMYDGAIVEFHLDAEVSADSTGRALPRIINDLRAQGYQFVTIPEMTQPC